MKKKGLTVFEIALFGVLGAVMFVSKMLMEVLPNIHLLGTLIVAYTVVFRAKALIPIYAYVLLDGLIHGFAAWWIAYLYIWAVLWGAVMLLPRRMKPPVAAAVYCAVSAAHGFLFGLLYAPVQLVVFYNMNLEPMKLWLVQNIPFDLIHGASNFLLMLALYRPMRRAMEGAVGLKMR